MRLCVPMVSAKETLTSLLNQGYKVFWAVQQDYARKREAGQYDQGTDIPRYKRRRDRWATAVVGDLRRVFPPELESNLFRSPDTPISYDSWYSFIDIFLALLRELEQVQRTCLPQYTDLLLQDRLYVEDIDSFHKVRDVNPARVAPFLSNGFLEQTGTQVRLALEQILEVPLCARDWGGEIDDLYTANVVANETRHTTASLLKGPLIDRKPLEVSELWAGRPPATCSAESCSTRSTQARPTT